MILQDAQNPENKPIHLYLASAGSGKTHTLAHDYLKLALRTSPDRFKYIVAITFTNRATEEMRDRLLKVLNELRHGVGTSHVWLSQTLHLSHEELKNRADALLNHMLHHYSHFCVCTMDVFLLRLMRAFLLEIGLSGHVHLSLDTTAARKKMVTTLLTAIGKNQAVTQWIQNFLEERLNAPEGYNWSLEEELFAFSEEIFKERFKKVFSEDKQLSEKTWQGMQNLAAHRHTHESTLTTQAKRALRLIEAAGYTLSDFSKNAGINILQKIVRNRIFFKQKLITTNVDKAAENPLLLLRKADRNLEIGSFVQHQLAPTFTALVDHISDSKSSTLYNSLRAIQSQIHYMGITSYMLDALREYRSYEHTFFLSDTLDILCRLTQHTHVPYVYEKLGAFFRHYLLDEFQDTSLFQWRALKPLILDGMSQEHKQYLVGDIKQSIYRWRGAASAQLLDEVKQDIPSYALHQSSLQTNWRSAKNIVSFNNQFFATLLHLPIFRDLSSDILRKTYENIQQKPSKKQSKAGYVSITGLEKSEHLSYTEQANHWCCEKIDALLAQGYQAEDICILVRKRAEGTQLLQTLLKHNPSYQIFTQESLLLAQAPPVQLLTHALRLLYHYSIVQNQDKLVLDNNKLAARDYFYLQYLAYTLGTQQMPTHEEFQQWSAHKIFSPTIQTFFKQRSVLLHLPLYLLCEKLIDLFSLHKYERYQPFVYDFMALLFAYQRQHGQNIAEFLKYWEEQSPKASLSSSSHLHATQILTIHKAKGLEFPVVLVPYATWALQSEHTSYLWTKSPVQGILSQLPFLALKYKKDLAHTYFSDEYEIEKVESYVDALNLLYVACTRPCKELHICYYSRAKDVYKLSTVGDVIQQLLGNDNGIFPKEIQKSGDKLFFALGSTTQAQANTRAKSTLSLPWQRPHHSGVSAHILATSKPQDSTQQQGIEAHEFLRTIHSWQDYKHKRRKQELLAPELLKLLDKLFSHKKVKDWFSGNWEIRHECELLVEGRVKRPDLVFLSSLEIHVADLKTGHPSSHHRQQVLEYLSILQRIHHQKIRGFLLYLKPIVHIISL